MNVKQKEMFFLDATELVNGVDFEVVTDTTFTEGAVERLYGVGNLRIDYALINILGLGVVKNIHFDDWYLYDTASDNIISETVRLGIYYQLSHPKYDDKELDRLIFGTPAGMDYVMSILGTDGVWVIARLKGIFDEKKGKVLEFRQRKN
ncbi:hypothetical protein [Oceanobacillus damuensis]|uniref:hypothetical protein n=1 Tax=Oceanobacillus damuensis TaxID=937928 RepID=UPI00082E532E|nr:hypothetical protein [Oceanobacillus damuensis]